MNFIFFLIAFLATIIKSWLNFINTGWTLLKVYIIIAYVVYWVLVNAFINIHKRSYSINVLFVCLSVRKLFCIGYLIRASQKNSYLKEANLKERLNYKSLYLIIHILKQDCSINVLFRMFVCMILYWVLVKSNYKHS